MIAMASTIPLLFERKARRVLFNDGRRLPKVAGYMMRRNSGFAWAMILRRCLKAGLAVALAALDSSWVEASIISARSASRADVGTAVTLAKDGDTVLVPAGVAVWTTTLPIAKNISLQGAGEGKTTITENLSRTGSPPLIGVSLSYDSPASFKYSFRLSGFTFKSLAGTKSLASDHAFVSVVGHSSYVSSPTAAHPAPYVLGCVNHVRLDHLTFDRMNGICMIVDSCLGVGDHITQVGIGGIYPIKTRHTNWTPAARPDGKGPMTTLAQRGFGSWADDPYWGTDKFWFWEDSTFSNNPNMCDNLGGSRVVIRHCTMDGLGMASHGMEGEGNVGIKQLEAYNNYFVLSGPSFAQPIRSGSCLFFNNKLANCMNGPAFYTYRQTRTENNWGAADGTNRYDNNEGGAPIYTGTVTGTNGLTFITDNKRANFNLINLADGTFYSVNDLDNPANNSLDPGWKCHHAGVIGSVNGNTLNLLTENGNGGASTFGNFSAAWKVGHRYEIRKVLACFGQAGQGKGRLLSPGGTVPPGVGASYNTYFWPATSGAKATYPQAGFPLEPCYAWNNTDVRNGQLGFFSNGLKNASLRLNRDYFNKGEMAPLVAQKVGYPAQDYTGATSNYPRIGPSGSAPYAPYTYPHPLANDGVSNPSPTPTAKPTTTPNPPTNLRVVPGG